MRNEFNETHGRKEFHLKFILFSTHFWPVKKTWGTIVYFFRQIHWSRWKIVCKMHREKFIYNLLRICYVERNQATFDGAMRSHYENDFRFFLKLRRPESTSSEIENREETAIDVVKPKLKQTTITNSHWGLGKPGIGYSHSITLKNGMANFVFSFFCILPLRSSLYSSVFEFKENLFRLHRLCAMKNVEMFEEADPN